MSLVVFQHQPDESSAVLGTILQGYGHKLRHIHFAQGDTVPADFDNVDGIVSMGGAMNVEDADQYPWIRSELEYLKRAHARGLPIVGVCLGAQMLAAALGGEVGKMDKPEVGWHNVKLAFPGTVDTLYNGITWDAIQFHVHGQEVKKLPPGAVPLAGSAACRTQAFKVGYKSYGFQYHFEWDRRDLEYVARIPFVTAAGGNSDSIIRDIDKHYENYRRRGDRLCHQIAMTLFPIDKR